MMMVLLYTVVIVKLVVVYFIFEAIDFPRDATLVKSGEVAQFLSVLAVAYVVNKIV